jgi:hypothetical protein
LKGEPFQVRTRWTWAAVAVAVAATGARADELPIDVQVRLLSKMATYVNTLGSLEGEVKVLVVYTGDAPTRGAQALVSAIGQVGNFGGVPVSAKTVQFSNAKQLRETIAADKPSVLYLAPELNAASVSAIVEAAAVGPLLTVTGVEAHVKQGAMLGFAMAEARPKVLVNLHMARKQSVEFKNGLVLHAVIVEP